MKKSKQLDTFEGGKHIVLVTFFENNSWIDFCIEKLGQGIENQHYCLLDTRSSEKDESVRISSKILERIDRDLVHKIFVGEFGSQEDCFTIDGKFEPERLQSLTEEIKSEISRLELKGFTAIHTSTFQYVNWIENPEEFAVEAELWTTNEFCKQSESNIFCIYRIKKSEFPDYLFFRLLSFHDSVWFMNEENKLSFGANAVQGVLANVC